MGHTAHHTAAARIQLKTTRGSQSPQVNSRDALKPDVWLPKNPKKIISIKKKAATIWAEPGKASQT